MVEVGPQTVCRIIAWFWENDPGKSLVHSGLNQVHGNKGPTAGGFSIAITRSMFGATMWAKMSPLNIALVPPSNIWNRERFLLVPSRQVKQRRLPTLRLAKL